MKRLGLYDVLLGGLVLTVISSGAVLMSIPVSADDVIDDFTININVSCTLFNNVGTPHTAEVPNGTYRADIGTTTIKAYCNDTNGFSIYAIGYTGEEYGVNTLVGTNASTNTISTGTATSGQTSNWAMKLNAVSGTYTPTILNSYDSYHAVPTTFEKVATYTSATDVGTTMANASGSSLTTTYAAYVSYTQPADTYVGKVKYTLVHPNDETPTQPQTTQAGQICYYPNGSNVEGTMGCQTIPASGGSTETVTPTSAVLLASNFSRAGYGFAGWSKTFDYSDDTGFLGPQEYIEFPAGTYTGNNDGLSLYARWIKSAGSLQGWTGCSSLQSGAVTALTDQRDNETYAVAKLADGNCWMIENLRLDNTATLTLANTNSPLNDGTNVTLKHNYSDTETYNTLSASQDPTATAWCNSNTASCDDQSMLFTGNTTNRASSPTANGVAMYSYGNYYNWYSATAGNGTYSFGTNNNSVAGDLCPAGWHLPKGGRKANVNVSDFWKLSRATIGADPANFANDYFYYTGTPEGTDASNKMRAYPNNFVYSGLVLSGSVNTRGSVGNYWSSTAYSSGYAYILYLRSSDVFPGTNYNYKYGGRSVRCIAPGV